MRINSDSMCHGSAFKFEWGHERSSILLSAIWSSTSTKALVQAFVQAHIRTQRNASLFASDDRRIVFYLPHMPQRPRDPHNASSSSNAPLAKPTKSVIPEATRKPVRAKPMRGPDAEASSSQHAGSSVPKSLSGKDASANQALPSHHVGDMQVKMKEDFCTQMLMGGYVQSFVDLFYLTHRNDPAALASHEANGGTDTAASMEGSSSFEISEMEFLRDQLVTAEHCKRKGEIPEVLNAYESLATYWMEKSDIKTMIFFYEKCLEIARLVNDPMCEMRVLNKIGAGYHSLRELEQACEYQERFVAIAQSVYEHEDDDELRGDAYRQLGKVYVDLAVQHESAKRYQESIDFYKKYLDCSSKAGDTECIMQAQFKVGACYNALTQPANALPFLEGYVRGFDCVCVRFRTANWYGCGLSCSLPRVGVRVMSKGKATRAQSSRPRTRNWETSSSPSISSTTTSRSRRKRKTS